MRGFISSLFEQITFFSKYSQNRLIKPTSPRYELCATKASGKLELEDIGVLVYFVHKWNHIVYMPHVSYTWIFHIDVNLRVHFKFSSVYFPLSPYDCLKGNLTIFQKTLFKPKFIFCGQMATFFLYPFSPKIDITVSVMEDILYKINMSYMVMDKNLIETTRGKFNSSKLLYSSLLIRGRISIVSYFVQVQKTQRILFRVSNTVHCLLFNGPGYLSEIIYTKDDQTNYKYLMSKSFQCLIQVMTSYKLYYYQRYFLYFAKHLKLHTFQMEPGQVQTVEIPSGLWNHTPCALYFKAPSDHHVNITILDQFYEGLRTMDCKYGGIAFVERIGYAYNEVKTFCGSSNSSKSQSRSIFSWGSSLIFVTYWYKFYSNILVKVNVTDTRCKSIKVDICKFNSRCYSYNEEKRCLEYMGPIFKALNIQLYFHDSNVELYYSLKVNQCVIFQFNQNLKFNTLFEKYRNYKYLSHCKFKIKTSNIEQPGYIVNYTFKGSSLHSKMDKRWSVSFMGLKDKFCYKLEMSNKTRCLFKTCSKINCFGGIYAKHYPFYKLSSESNVTDFLIVAETTSPTFDTSFNFELNFARWTQSWMDMVVWMDKSLSFVQYQYPHEGIPLTKDNYKIKNMIGNPKNMLMIHLKTENTFVKKDIIVKLEMYSIIERRPWKYYSSLDLEFRDCFNLSTTFNYHLCPYQVHCSKFWFLFRKLAI